MKTPINVIDNIPVYTKRSDYTDNYEKINRDILDHAYGNPNPYVPESLWREYEDSTREIVKRYVNRGDKVLDVGVGLGRLLSELKNVDKYGIDISLEMLKIARTKGIEVAYALAEDMPYFPETFDVVICADVLEHVLDLNLAITKILDVIKPGGYLIVRVPYKESLRKYLKTNKGYEFIHLRNFDEVDMELLFKHVHGCSIVEISKAGYEITRDRLRWFYLPTGDVILRNIFRFIPRMFWGLFFNPVEINAVIRR